MIKIKDLLYANFSSLCCVSLLQFIDTNKDKKTNLKKDCISIHFIENKVNLTKNKLLDEEFNNLQYIWKINILLDEEVNNLEYFWNNK